MVECCEGKPHQTHLLTSCNLSGEEACDRGSVHNADTDHMLWSHDWTCYASNRSFTSQTASVWLLDHPCVVPEKASRG